MHKKFFLITASVALLVILLILVNPSSTDVPAQQSSSSKEGLATHLPPTHNQYSHGTGPAFSMEQVSSGLPDDLTTPDDFLALVPLELVTHTATVSGRWSDPSIWADGIVPVPGARVHIPAGVTITIDFLNDTHLKSLRIDGTLRMAQDVATMVKVDALVVNESGTFEAGTTKEPIQQGAESLVTLAAYYTGKEDDNQRKHSALFVSMGSVSVHGQSKSSMMTLAHDPMAGDKSLALTKIPTNWQAGDILGIGGSGRTADQESTIRIEENKGQKIVLGSPDPNATDYAGLASDHDTSADQLAFAVNVSRNAGFSTPADAEGPQGSLIFYGNGVSQASLGYVGAYGLGMSGNATEDGHADDQMTRPAMSFRNGLTSSSPTLSGLAFVNSPEDPIELDRATIQVRNSVSWNEEGSAWLTDNGSPSSIIWSGKRTTSSVLKAF